MKLYLYLDSNSSFQSNPEMFLQGNKSPYIPRTTSTLATSKPPFIEQRITPPFNVTPDMLIQGRCMVFRKWFVLYLFVA